MTAPIPLEIFDYVMVFWLAIILPVWSYWDHQGFERELEAGNSKAIRSAYLKTYYALWTPTLLLAVYWFVSGRPYGALGLSLTPTLSAAIGMVVALIIAAILTAQVFQAKNNSETAAQVRTELRRSPSIEKILPKTETDYRLFQGLSISAGITEEILYRGYLIWAFSFWMESWLAALLALAVFALAHLYQGTSEAILKVTLTGGALSLLYLLSGSLLPAILLHAAIDLTSGATCWYANRNRGEKV